MKVWEAVKVIAVALVTASAAESVAAAVAIEVVQQQPVSTAEVVALLIAAVSVILALKTTVLSVPGLSFQLRLRL